MDTYISDEHAFTIFWFEIYTELSGAVICCWPLPAQSLSVSGTVSTHDHIFVHVF
jgi:hypothetical protein